MKLRTVGSITFYEDMAEQVVKDHYTGLKNYFSRPEIQKLISENNYEKLFYDYNYGFPMICAFLLAGIDFLKYMKDIPEEALDADYMEECGILYSIDFPETIESIGAGAFYSCSNLEYIILPHSLKEIGKEAFFYTGLSINDNEERVKYRGKRIELASNVSVIGDIFTKDKREITIHCNDGKVWFY